MTKKNLTLGFLIFSFISLIIIFSWFRYGLIFGGGDVGLPTYNPQRIFEISKYIWWEAAAPGALVPNSTVSAPLAFVLSIFQQIGFSPIFLQATLFLTLLILMGYGMYLFCLNTFGKDSKYYAILAGFFYMLNPYMMIQVWHRFVHTTFFLVAALPFLTYFWILWIKKGNLKYLLLFLLTSFLAVYSFGTIAYILSFWLFLLLISTGIAIFPWQGIKRLSKLAYLYLVGLFCWVLTNSWWLISTFSVGPGLFVQQHSSEDSLVTLVNISKQAILPFTLQMVNPFYLYNQLDFGAIYKSLPFMVIPWIFFAFILVGLIGILRRKELVFWPLVFLSIVFFSKGVSGPFGYLYIQLFTHIFAVGAIRNPFEKIGIFLPFVAAILLIVGLQTISKPKVVGLVFFILLGLLGGYAWPMFTGGVFGNINNPAFVEIPDSIQKADEWISQRSLDGKILHLPLPVTEDVKYNWKFGYSGVDPNALLFTVAPSIARGFNLKTVDDSLTALSLVFFKPLTLNEDKILELLSSFNIRFIVLHKDIDWRGRELYDPRQTEVALDNLPFFSNKVTFENLVVYEISDEYFSPKMLATVDIKAIQLGESLNIWPWLAMQKTGNVISNPNGSLDNLTLTTAREILILPEVSFSFRKVSDQSSSLNQLVQIVEVLNQNGEIQSKSLAEEIISSTEILTEVSNLTKDDQAKSSKLLNEYKRIIERIFEKEIDDYRLTLYVGKPVLSDIFQQQLLILEKLKTIAFSDSIFIDELYFNLKEKGIKNNLFSKFIGSIGKDSESKQVFKIQLPQNAKYEVLMTNPQIDYYTNNLEELEFDFEPSKREVVNSDQLPIILKGQVKENFLSFGEIELNAGEYEISYKNISSKNLLSEDRVRINGDVKFNKDGETEIISKEKTSYLEIPIEATINRDLYKVSFEAIVQEGEGFQLQFEQDTDPYDSLNQRVSQINQFIPQVKGNQWINYNFNLPALRLTTTEGVLRILVPQQNSLLIRNLKIEKILNNPIMLKIKPKNQLNVGSKTIIEFQRESPVKYFGKIVNKDPVFLIFKETYHPGWSLTLTESGGKSYKIDKHYLSNLYGNAWYIEKGGEYNFNLEFEPQKSVSWGIITALITLTILLIINFRKYVRV